MLLMDIVLDTTSPEMVIIIVRIGPVIYTMIGHILVMGIIGAMKVETAKMIEDLSVILLMEDLELGENYDEVVGMSKVRVMINLTVLIFS